MNTEPSIAGSATRQLQHQMQMAIQQRGGRGEAAGAPLSGESGEITIEALCSHS